MKTLRAELEQLLLKLIDARVDPWAAEERLFEIEHDLKHILDFHTALQQPASLLR